MKELLLSGSTWQNPDDFYNAFFKAVGAPDWHGRNFNALSDSIQTGDINKIEVPYTIKITGLSKMSPAALKIVKHFSDLIHKLQEDGVDVSIVLDK